MSQTGPLRSYSYRASVRRRYKGVCDQGPWHRLVTGHHLEKGS